MPHQPTIDGFEFASAGATQQGVWPLKDFPRLRDVLASDAGEVAYEISGVRDDRGRPGLRLKVSGTLMLRCQRETFPSIRIAKRMNDPTDSDFV